MKKLILLIAVVAFSHSITFSQGCLPEGITFTTQAQIDNFQVNYPGCTEIVGNVQIGKQWENSNISNLSGLNILTSIDSNLILWNNNLLSSLSGLENLSYVGGNLEIFRNDLLSGLSGLESLSFIGRNLEIIQNNSLSGLTGLDALQYIGGDFRIYGNEALLTLAALNGLDSIGGSLTLGTYPFDMDPCQGNHVLTSLTGLDNLNSIGGNFDILCTSLFDLTGLGSLSTIGGSLNINGNGSLINLTGADNLTSIEENLSIGYSSWLFYMPNPSLTSLEGLGGLVNIGGDFSIKINDVLSDLTALGQLSSIGGDLMINSSPSLTTLTGLGGLDSIGSRLSIGGNNSLTSLAGLGNISPGSVTNLTITDNSMLTDCAAQSICDYLSSPNGTVNIYSNAVGCNNPVEVATGCGITLPCLPFGDYHFFTQADVDNFKVNYPACTDLQGNATIGEGVSHLDSLSSIISIGGTLDLSGGVNLTSLSGLDNLQAIGGNLNVSGANNLANFSGLDQLELIGGSLLLGYNNASLTSMTGLGNLTSIGGYFFVSTGHNLTDLTGLSNLETIGGGLSSPGGLPNYKGLEGLTSIGGTVWIQFEYSLINFEGLENVETIGGDLVVNICNVSSMAGFDNLNHIGGQLIIGSNEHMVSLSGLNSLTTIGGKLHIFDNPPLESLSGLENIQAGLISQLKIWDNVHLSECAVQSICDYLAAPNGTIEIHNNATSCNSQEEVLLACSNSLKELGIVDEVSIFPNPSMDFLIISTQNGASLDEVVIYNQTGQKVLQSKPVNNTLDISKLKPGMYIVEMVTDQGRVREKLVVE